MGRVIHHLTSHDTDGTHTGHIPMPLLLVVFGRDALLIAGSFVKRAAQRPEGSPFFDTTSSATFQITPNLLSKVRSCVQRTAHAMVVI
jgi:hypothetical protein